MKPKTPQFTRSVPGSRLTGAAGPDSQLSPNPQQATVHRLQRSPRLTRHQDRWAAAANGFTRVRHLTEVAREVVGFAPDRAQTAQILPGTESTKTVRYCFEFPVLPGQEANSQNKRNDFLRSVVYSVRNFARQRPFCGMFRRRLNSGDESPRLSGPPDSVTPDDPRVHKFEPHRPLQEPFR